MTTDSTSTEQLTGLKSGTTEQPDVSAFPPRDWRFWMIIFSISISQFLAALELCAVGNTLPSIIHDLHGEQFDWVGSAYTLATAAFIPLTGGLAQIFGRRIVMLGSLFLFALGSALSGAASSLNFLIAGRTVQGLGGGGITAMTQIILSDLVTLRERGSLNGIIVLSWAVAGTTGPLIGGSLAQHGQWRWLFYLNIPIAGFAAGFIVLFLRLRTPSGKFIEKVKRIDWIGNFLVIASTTLVVIALTWGGIQFSWGSANILVPLILGLAGLAAFFVYEWKVAEHSMVPFILMSTLTGVSGYIQSFINGIITMALVYYLPVYFQACKDMTPIGSAVIGFGLGFLFSPSSFTAGILITKMNSYRSQGWAGWVSVLVGLGLLSTLEVDTSRGKVIGYEILVGVGTGILYVSTYFPALAPVPVKENARALAFFYFVRQFSYIWGVAIGATVLQNELHKNLPAEFTARFPQGTEIAYAVIPEIRGMEDPLRGEVRAAFAKALQRLWEVLTGIGGIGFLVSLLMKHIPLNTSVDEDWGMQQRTENAMPQNGIEPKPEEVHAECVVERGG